MPASLLEASSCVILDWVTHKGKDHGLLEGACPRNGVEVLMVWELVIEIKNLFLQMLLLCQGRARAGWQSRRAS